MVDDGLRPARRRRVLRADIPRHGEHGAPLGIGQVTHHADVAAVAEPSGTPQWTAEGIGDGQTHREQEWPRPVVGSGAVVPAGHQRSEHDLRHFMTARRKLVQHEMLARHGIAETVGGLFDVVEGARDQREIGNPPPVKPRMRDGP